MSGWPARRLWGGLPIPPNRRPREPTAGGSIGRGWPNGPHEVLVAIAGLDRQAAVDLLNAIPSLATAGRARRDEFFLAERLAQVYEGGTALHAAGFSYDSEIA
jgi:hypothetical protein